MEVPGGFASQPEEIMVNCVCVCAREFVFVCVFVCVCMYVC